MAVEKSKSELVEELLPKSIGLLDKEMALLDKMSEVVRKKRSAVKLKRTYANMMLKAARKGKWKEVKILHGEMELIQEPKWN